MEKQRKQQDRKSDWSGRWSMGLIAALVLVTASSLDAQAPTAALAVAPAAPPATFSTKDWPGLDHYRAADAAVSPPVVGEDRVVFMGDSITNHWRLNDSSTGFPGKPYLNRGIDGQVTAQMLVRFRQDVIDLRPRVVVIMGGTDDIAGNMGDENLEQIENNLASMADLARVNDIRVVLSSVLPSSDFPWRRGMRPAESIAELNSWIKRYAGEHHYIYVDYFSAMKDRRGGLPEKYSRDGVHPNAAGYRVMVPLAEQAIRKALNFTSSDCHA